MWPAGRWCGVRITRMSFIRRRIQSGRQLRGEGLLLTSEDERVDSFAAIKPAKIEVPKKRKDREAEKGSCAHDWRVHKIKIGVQHAEPKKPAGGHESDKDEDEGNVQKLRLVLTEG